MSNIVRQLERDPGVIIARRGLTLSKLWVIFALLFASMAILTASLANTFLSGVPGGRGMIYAGPSVSLLSVGLAALAAFFLMTPVILLYVYDKKNGVLEYFLSLGMNQGDIYKRYLKAAVVLDLVLMAAVAAGNVVVALMLRADLMFPLEVSAFAAALSLSIVSFGTIALIAFNSLQKPIAGANQPFGLALAALLVMPAYLAPWILPFSVVVVVDLAEAVLVASLAVVLFLLASRLISREKLLP
jgi:hypothetical protein